MEIVKEKTEEKKPLKSLTQEMMKAGLHFGHKVSRCHPKMKPYVFGVRGNIHILNLEKTVQKLEEALNFIKELVLNKKILMIVGTKIPAKELVKEIALKHNLPYVNEKWVGGTFTNFDVIKKRIDYFKELDKRKKDNRFENYTKKEKMKIDKELKEFEEKFGGIKNLERIPDAIFVIDANKEDVAIREARKKGVKVIAVVDTDNDPTLVDYPIPANDDAISSIRYILDQVDEIIKKYKK